jgi:hypothetical protein
MPIGADPTVTPLVHDGGVTATPLGVTGPGPRDELLYAMYDEAEGAVLAQVNPMTIAERLGMTHVQRDAALIYFKQHHWIDGLTFGGESAWLTASGVDKVERDRRLQQRAPTPPVAPTVAVYLTVVEKQGVEELLTSLARDNVGERLDDDHVAEYEATRDLATMELRKENSERGLVKRLVSRLVDFAVQAGATISAEIIAKLTGL